MNYLLYKQIFYIFILLNKFSEILFKIGINYVYKNNLGDIINRVLLYIFILDLNILVSCIFKVTSKRSNCSSPFMGKHLYMLFQSFKCHELNGVKLFYRTKFYREKCLYLNKSVRV